MKALIQKEIVRKPVYPHGEGINGCIESETTIIRIFGIIAYQKVIELSSVR